MAEAARPEVVMRARPAVRFAPSPNGYLHLGHAFSALFTAEVARVLDARLVLRIEDIDRVRARPHFVSQLLDDLDWLGLTFEEPVRRQSEHIPDYAAALGRLDALGVVYASRASRGEIARFVARREAAGTPWPRDPDGAPLFPGIGRVAMEEAGEKRDHAVRIDMAAAIAALKGPVGFTEIGPERGSTVPIVAEPGKWGDVIVARRDIATSYHLSVVVDDAVQGISHVTRGMDLFEATHLHRLLQELLGLPAPVYCHHPLVRDAAGRKLAKTLASVSLKSLRAEGATRADIVAATGIAKWRPWCRRQLCELVSRTLPNN
jgi:glutamyl-Q tRNA(Asp) synthetase